jgi:hypothetical protein
MTARRLEAVEPLGQKECPDLSAERGSADEDPARAPFTGALSRRIKDLVELDLRQF